MKRILFEDEFDGDRLDPVWFDRGTEHVDGMGYARGDRRGVDVSDGRVHLRTIADPDNPPAQWGPYLNGHVGANIELTSPLWVAVRAKVHPFHGSHCSGWLQSWGGYGPGDAEVDIFEGFGSHKPDKADGTNVWHNVYWREADTPPGEYRRAFAATNDREFLSRGAWHEAEHTFKLHWTRDFYRFYIDNRMVAEIREGLSITPKFPILSMLTRDYEVVNQGVHRVGEQPPIVHPLASTVMDVSWIRAWRNVTA